MTKQKSRIISKHPLHKRTTFKKHPKHYVKVYAPYLPAVVGLVVGLALLMPAKLNSSKSVLSYATSTSSESLLDETNNRRADDDVNKLSLNDSLSKAAQLKAQDMANRNYWSHVTPDGRQPWYFIDKSGYKYSQAAENLAYGFSSSKDTINGWMNSPEHRKTMLNTNLSDVGFGIANVANYQNKGPETVVVAIYATPEQPDLSKVNSAFTDKPGSSISLGQILTGGSSPWIDLIAGVAMGIIIMYLVTTHSLKLRRKIKRSERYILSHPVFDISLVVVLVILIALSKTVGFIQ